MQGFMVMLLVCSVTISGLSVLYMALTPLLTKHYSAMGLYYIWLVLVTGLIIPFRPQFSHAVVKVNMQSSAAAPIIRTGSGAPVLPPAPGVLPAAVPHITWWQAAAAVWLAGTILFLAYHMIRHYHFLKLTARWSENVTDGQTLTIFQDLKQQMGISHSICLQVCSSIGSPMMAGFARPRILLPTADFPPDELRFILKHELVHYRRKDLWYKGLVLAATAIHWFNPMVYLMAGEIGRLCELSCDAEVVRNTDEDTRLYYSETIIGVIRYKSKLKTALSTNFYGGKRNMKTRIFSIMDMRRKKAGAAVLCGALILTMGTGATWAAGKDTQDTTVSAKEASMVTPWMPIALMPAPETYAPYTAYGITISEDGTKLLYKGQPVRLFADEKSDAEAFYWDEAGSLNLSAVRNAANEITGVEGITEQKAQEYYENFFAEELDPGFRDKVQQEAVQDLARETVNVNEKVQEGGNKYEKYQPFGLTFSETDQALYFNGQRVKFFIDQIAGESAETLWTDEAGTVNAAAVHNAAGQITGIEGISDKKAQEYQSVYDKYLDNALDGLEERIEERINKAYSGK